LATACFFYDVATILFIVLSSFTERIRLIEAMDILFGIAILAARAPDHQLHAPPRPPAARGAPHLDQLGGATFGPAPGCPARAANSPQLSLDPGQSWLMWLTPAWRRSQEALP